MGVPLSALNTPPAAGAGDMFLKVTGAKHGPIHGEAEDAQHKWEVEVLSWSWGMQGKSALGGGTATGMATMRELRIVKRVDKASTALMGALRSNEQIKDALLTIRKGGGAKQLEFFTIKIEDGRVIALDIEGGDTANNPVLLERVSFTFNKISVTYKAQDAKGALGGGLTFEDEWTPAGQR